LLGTEAPHDRPQAQELVKLINSRLAEGVEPLRVGALPHWQLALPDLKNK
jgi:hypothetical protein